MWILHAYPAPKTGSTKTQPLRQSSRVVPPLFEPRAFYDFSCNSKKRWRALEDDFRTPIVPECLLPPHRPSLQL
jgi:hypothetical protein